MSRNFMNRDFLRWLTTCLLVILAILLLALNLVSFASASGANNPSSGKQSNSSSGKQSQPLQNQTTQTPLPLTLEKTYCQIPLKINADGLLNTNSTIKDAATKDIESQINTQSFLQGRQVGLAIVYGSTLGGADTNKAIQIAQQIYSILQKLGTEKKSAFMDTSYFEPLVGTEHDSSYAQINVYLFKQAGQTTDTCDSSSHQPKK